MVHETAQSSESILTCILAVLRIVTALLLLSAGLVKLVGSRRRTAGTDAIMSLLGAAAFGSRRGILLIIGSSRDPSRSFVRRDGRRLLDRSCAKSFFPVLNQGTPAILFCFILCILWQQEPVR